jgi:hypothetical protein
VHINLVFGGRSQGEGDLNGSTELTELLKEKVADAGYSEKQVRVYFYPWWANTEDIARRLYLLKRRYKLEDDEFGINCYAFSRGVGVAVKRLAGWAPVWRRFFGKSGLERFGLSIDTGVYCDGIYHHWISIGGFQWRSVLKGFGIDKGYHICLHSTAGQMIYAFRQEISRPMGMELIVTPPSVLVGGKAKILKYEHVEMDDAKEYHAKCVEVMLEGARRYVPYSEKKAMPTPTVKAPAPTPSEVLESKFDNRETVTTTEEVVTGEKAES